MTLSVVPTTPRVSYTVGATAQTDFPVPFPFDDVADLAVTVNQAPVLFALVATLTQDGFFLASTVRLNAPAPPGAVVGIARATLLKQGAVFPLAGAFRTATLNREVSRLWMVLQDLASRIGQAIRVPSYEPGLSELPAKAQRTPGKFLTFDSNGDLALSFGQVGPQGPQGPTGPVGPQGPRGATGPTGPQGPTGPAGPQGVQGIQGVVGPKGDPGNYLALNFIGSGTSLSSRPTSASNGQAWGLLSGDSVTVYIWSAGAWYNAGTVTAAVGPQGPQGPTGPQGAVGPRGPQGADATPEDIANVIHVQEFGDDANDGLSWGTAVRTIERAVSLATARGELTLIEVGPMEIVTRGNLALPDDAILRCAHRSVTVRPEAGYEENNVFLLGSGCFAEGFLFEGWRIDDLANPTKGFAFAFRPGAVINRVPYVHKVAVRTVPSWGLVPPPLNRDAGNPFVGRGAGVVLADGAVVSGRSRFANIMTWGATPVSPNGIGYCAKNGALINAVNAVSMWAHKHHLALSGGRIILSACATQFGDYAFYASGSRAVVVPVVAAGTLTVQAAASAAIQAAQAAIIDAMWSALVAGGYTAGWPSDAEGKTRADAAIFLQALRWVLESADPLPMQNFARGLFTVTGERVFSAGKLPAFVFAFNNMRDSINALGIAAAAQLIVTNQVAALNQTLTSPVTRLEPSRITAIGHTWQDPMVGVALTKIPPTSGAGSIQDSIMEVEGGTVVASGQDDKGNALFVGGMTIDADTGEASGPPFQAAVRRAAIRAAFAAGSF